MSENQATRSSHGYAEASGENPTADAEPQTPAGSGGAGLPPPASATTPPLSPAPTTPGTSAATAAPQTATTPQAAVPPPAAPPGRVTAAPPAYYPPGPPYGAGPPYLPTLPVPVRPESNRGEFGRILAILVAMALLAVASGLFGGWVATQSQSDIVSPITSGDGRPVPDIDRSSLAEVVTKVRPSVVSVKTGNGEGSGVVLNRNGLVLTNNHVVAGAQGDTLAVVFSNGTSRGGTIVGTDPRSDLAVVKVDGSAGLNPAVFGDSDAMNVGDTVLALGSPLGLEGSVTSGIISAKDRTIRSGDQQPGGAQGGAASISGMLQTDAAVNPGNSGGPLVNLAGEVIGINTAIATAGGGNGNIGVGFAIPSNTAKRVAEALIAGEKVSHPQLGIAVADTEGKGALAQSVTPDGPADQAGLREGDVITRFGDRVINNADDLVAAVQGAQVGDRIAVTYTRSGDERRVTVTMGEAPGD